MDILILFAFLVFGAALGWALRTNLALAAVNGTLTRFSIWGLLAVMGAKVAQHRALLINDVNIFIVAIGSSVALTLVFFLAFWLVERVGLHKKRGASQPTAPVQGSRPNVQGRTGGLQELMAVGINGGCILVGLLLFWLLPENQAGRIPIDTLTDWLLRALLFFIGFDLGAELHRLDLRRLPPSLLLAPFINISLSLGVGLTFGLLAGMGARDGSLITSGMGWYSLSSVLLAERGMMLLSILAFIHNVFRELLAIVSAPFAAKVSPLLPVYLGGATSMDVMLPFVQRYSGTEYTLVSFYSGVVCSIAVMPLVKLIAM